MKFLLIGSLQTPYTGGKFRWRSIARFLAREGHEVIYIEPAAPGFEEEVNMEAVKHIRTRYPGWKFNLGVFYATLHNCLKALRAGETDYVISFKPLPSSCIPALLKKSKRPRLILDIDDLEYAYWESRPALKYALRFFEKQIVKFFDNVTVHNRNLEEYCREELKVKDGRIIPLAQGLEPDTYRGIEPASLAGYDNRPLIAYTAFLGVAANLDGIFESIKLLREKYPDILLLVIGGGPKLDRYREYCGRENLPVVFTGYKPHTKALQIIKACGVAINFMPDNYANKYRSPIKIREYLALGCKAVSNNIGDTAAFSDYIYMSGNDTEDFAHKIETALKDDWGKAEKGREFVFSNYGWDAIIKGFLKDLADGET